MKIENGKIVEATEQELWGYWLSRDWYEIMDFNEFLLRCKYAGTTVVKEDGTDES